MFNSLVNTEVAWSKLSFDFHRLSKYHRTDYTPYFSSRWFTKKLLTLSLWLLHVAEFNVHCRACKKPSQFTAIVDKIFPRRRLGCCRCSKLTAKMYRCRSGIESTEDKVIKTTLPNISTTPIKDEKPVAFCLKTTLFAVPHYYRWTNSICGTPDINPTSPSSNRWSAPEHVTHYLLPHPMRKDATNKHSRLPVPLKDLIKLEWLLAG